MSAYDGLPGDWELVVGLEVHVELATTTKLFSASPNRFGDEPNTNIDPVTLGLPGALPVLNEQAVELAMRVGAALNCTIQACTFHRKNYFYPDMPKAYQVTQYDQPLNVDGHLDLPNGVRVGIERAHMEEDAGFEHSIANMFIFPMAMLLQAAGTVDAVPVITVWGCLANLAAVILGNLIGGSVLVGLVYHIIYHRHSA